MSWSWQEVYDGALIEEDPDKRRERLVTAEKAIVQRIQQLSDGTEGMAEACALREALDCLYARFAQGQHPPAELAGQTELETNGSQIGRASCRERV